MRCGIPHGTSSGHSILFGNLPWSETHEERLHKRMLHSQRGNWQSVDGPPHSSGSEHYDIFPAGVPLTSRKSSSSTDSSSCLSIHSRSTSSSDKGSDGVGGGGVSLELS